MENKLLLAHLSEGHEVAKDIPGKWQKFKCLAVKQGEIHFRRYGSICKWAPFILAPPCTTGATWAEFMPLFLGTVWIMNGTTASAVCKTLLRKLFWNGEPYFPLVLAAFYRLIQPFLTIDAHIHQVHGNPTCGYGVCCSCSLLRLKIPDSKWSILKLFPFYSFKQ